MDYYRGGITRYRPSRVAPHIAITDVISDNRHGAVPEVRISTSQDYLAFEFQGRSMSTHWSDLAYIYQLDGYDEQPNTTRDNRVEYADLPIGEHTFRVRAVDRDLNYSVEAAAVQVVVHPAYQDLVAWIIPKNILSLVFSTLGVVQMPHKFNAARRHKFDKVQYRVINWAEYNESLRQRGDLTIWVSEEAQSVWSAPRRTSRGGQRRYSDLAIETCLMLRTAYHLGLRQTQGLMGSIGTLMGLDIRVPDYSTLSRRANGVSIAQVMRQAGSVPIHLVVDSTGLKIFGEGEWLAQKHNTKGIRRRWRKLHLGLDLASGAIGCAALTPDLFRR